MGQHFPHQRQTLAKIIGTIIGTMRAGGGLKLLSWLASHSKLTKNRNVFSLVFVLFFKKYEQSHHFCPSPSQLQKQILTEWGVDHTTYHHQPSNLALTGHLGELSPPQLRVLSLQNQQPVLGAADASIDQIDSSQKSLHFFFFFV